MIGVVGNVLHDALDAEAKPEIYVPVQQAPNDEDSPMIVVRTALDPGAAAAEPARRFRRSIPPCQSTGSEHWAAGVGIGGAAAFSHCDPDDVRDPGAGDGVDRDLWSDEPS